MKIEKASVNGSLASVRVYRQAGQGQVNKIRVIIYNETDSEVKEVSGLAEMESRTYSIETSISNASKIAIVPVMIKDEEDKLGMKSDDYTLRKETIVNVPITPSGCTSNNDCTSSDECKNSPGTCSSGGCSFSNKADGVSCTSCSGNCWCQSGSCVAKLVSTCPAGLVAYWKFNDNLDDPVSGNSGTLVNSVSYTDGKFGKALQFNGGYANFVDTPSLRLPTELTIEFWAKRVRLNDLDIILEKGGDWNYNDPNYGVGLQGTLSNNAMFYFFYNGGYKGTSGVQDLNWHYYTINAKNGDSSVKLYIDGVEKTVQYSGGTPTVNLYNSNLPLHIGVQLGSYSYYGRAIIDNVALYNKQLTSQEILEHYNSGNGKELC